MKMKLMLGLALFASCCASANAAPRGGANGLGVIVLPALKLVDSVASLANPVLQPVLSKTGPIAGGVVADLHPVFVVVGAVLRPKQHGETLVVHGATLPGLPN